ncbi:MAG: glycosyltransferase family 2 protein [Planctomycetes bacterium]|nr:glycosyltransferase family 2 protein [Planctomycetota bacterium]
MLLCYGEALKDRQNQTAKLQDLSPRERSGRHPHPPASGGRPLPKGEVRKAPSPARLWRATSPQGRGGRCSLSTGYSHPAVRGLGPPTRPRMLAGCGQRRDRVDCLRDRTLPVANRRACGMAESVVVVIPALNEEATVGDVVRAVPRELPGATVSHVVVVDDGSSDRTAQVAAEAGAVVVRHPRNLGSGAAFATGRFKAVELGADIICHIDADGQFDPADIPKLLEPLLKGEADFATCSRFARKDLEPQMPRVKKWGNRMVTRLVNWAAGTRFTDASCGFRAYTRETAHQLNLFSRFDYAQETLMLLSRGTLRLVEVPLAVRGVREHGQSRIAGSVLSYGARCFSILMLTMRDMHPLRFFGAIGTFFVALGAFLGLWVLVHWLHTGQTAPYTSFLTGSALGLTLGVVLYVLALLADMVVRQRVLQERMLLELRRMSDEIRNQKSEIRN